MHNAFIAQAKESTAMREGSWFTRLLPCSAPLGVGVFRLHPLSLSSLKFTLGFLDLRLHLVCPLLQTLLIYLALCSRSFSKSSFFMRSKFGILLQKSHACSLLSWRRRASFARACQRSRLRRKSPGLMFTNSWRFWVPSLPVAIM